MEKTRLQKGTVIAIVLLLLASLVACQLGRTKPAPVVIVATLTPGPVTPTQPPPGAPTSLPPAPVSRSALAAGPAIDDFEGGDFEARWWSDVGEGTSSFTCAPEQPGHDSAQALRLTFELGVEGYAGCGLSLDPGQWKDARGLSFSWRADQADLVVTVGVGVEDPTQTNPDAGGITPFDAGLTPGEEWTPVTLTWDDLARSEWVGESGDDTVDPARIIALNFYVSGQSGSVWIDDLQLLAEPSAAEVAAVTPPAALTAPPTALEAATPTTAPPSASVAPSPAGALVQPSDLAYLGAFRLPSGDDRPQTFAYGGNAMTFNPNGDPAGSGDGFPGSLFITGHDRLPYGELPDGSQVAEIGIPAPVASKDLNQLPQAGFLQDFRDVAAGQFVGFDEIPRLGLAYLDIAATGPKIHLAWGQHMPSDPAVPTHAWFDPNLAAPNFQGAWFIGNQGSDSVNGYLFVIPTAWADAHTAGRYLATGRFRDGGWSSMGPTLFAYRPWQADGSPPPAGAHLAETVLLLYADSHNTESIEHCLDGYQHPDEWEGGAWLTTSSGKTAVLFAGTKSTGDKYWYGWVNPAGPSYPCIELEFVNDFPVCRLANNQSCPPEDLTECAGHNDYRGWWSTHFDAQFILYNPADLARVAAGAMPSWQPQPYASLDIDDYLFLNPAGVEQDLLGVGDQRRYRIGDVAYDRDNGLLYVLEMFADEAKPVVHVWRINQ